MSKKASASPKAEHFKTKEGHDVYAERHGNYYVGAVIVSKKKGVRARWRLDGSICGVALKRFDLAIPAQAA